MARHLGLREGTAPGLEEPSWPDCDLSQGRTACGTNRTSRHQGTWGLAGGVTRMPGPPALSHMPLPHFLRSGARSLSPLVDVGPRRPLAPLSHSNTAASGPC